jgi:tetratricopeptide (TPR) repeat protein
MTKETEIAINLSVRAWQTFEKGDALKAKSLYLRALVLFERCESPYSLNVASVLNRLGLVCEKRAEYEDAQHYFSRAISILENIDENNRLRRLYIQALYHLARIRSIQGFYCEAKQTFRRALALAEAKFGSKDLEVATILTNLGTLYKRMERFHAARSYFYRALRILEEKLDAHHPQVASLYQTLSLLEFAAGRSHKGEPFARRCIRIRVKYFGADHIQVASGLTSLALLLDAQKKDSQAEKLYQRATMIFGQGEGFFSNLNRLAEDHQSRGEHEEAQWICRRMLALQEGAPRPDRTMDFSLPMAFLSHESIPSSTMTFSLEAMV